jgi:hypothetical protein
MEFETLLQKVGDEPVFESSFLLAGAVKPLNLRLQLSRWVKTGKLFQLRKGLYCLAPPYRKTVAHPFVVANRLVRASYVSGMTALAFYGLIPEIVNRVTSVTSGRPGYWENPLGDFEFQHLQTRLLSGYQMKDLGGDQQALIALPEKALLDLVYLQAGGQQARYLRSLRLQNLDGTIHPEILLALADKFDRPKMTEAARIILQIMAEETGEYQTL